MVVQIYYTKNGDDLGLAFTIPKNLARSAFYPAICLKNAEVPLRVPTAGRPWSTSQCSSHQPMLTRSDRQVHLNFGGSAFSHLPEGYCGLVNANTANTTTSTASATPAHGGKGKVHSAVHRTRPPTITRRCDDGRAMYAHHSLSFSSLRASWPNRPTIAW